MAAVAALTAVTLLAGCGGGSESAVEKTGRAIVEAGKAAHGSPGELRKAIETAQRHLRRLEADGGLNGALRTAFCNGAMSVVRHGSLPEGYSWRHYLISQVELDLSDVSNQQVTGKVDELEAAGKLVIKNGGTMRAYEHSCATSF